MEKGTATHSGILAWRIPWTEELRGLQSMGSQRIGYDRATNTTLATYIHFVGGRDGEKQLSSSTGMYSINPLSNPPTFGWWG